MGDDNTLYLPHNQTEMKEGKKSKEKKRQRPFDTRQNELEA